MNPEEEQKKEQDPTRSKNINLKCDGLDLTISTLETSNSLYVDENPEINETREDLMNHTEGDIRDEEGQETPKKKKKKGPLSFLKKPKIVGIDLVPDWLKDNKFLIKGYRVNYNRKRDLFKSLFSIHNETLNIWTHLLGAIIFVVLSIYIAIYFDAAKKIFLDFIGKFKKIDISSIVKKTVEKDIVPLINSLKNTIKGKKKKELMDKAVYFKNNYETLIKKSKELNSTDSNNDLAAVNKFYWLIAQIKKLSSSINMDKVKLKNTKQLLAALTLTNVIHDLEIWPILLYIFTAIFCLGSSATFHWFYPKNEKVSKILNRIDLASITILIWGSAISVIYYYFYCNKGWFYFYFLLLTSTCGVVFYLSMQDFWYTEKWRKFKGYTYIFLGMFSGFSIFHCMYRSAYYGGPGTDVLPVKDVARDCIIMGLTYIIGTQFYIWRIPERWKPGLFDIWFNSHTIFHGFVFAAAVIHFFAVKSSFKLRAETSCIVSI